MKRVLATLAVEEGGQRVQPESGLVDVGHVPGVVEDYGPR